jgi:type II secretory pathway component GspD/PulD (secretin)
MKNQDSGKRITNLVLTVLVAVTAVSCASGKKNSGASENTRTRPPGETVENRTKYDNRYDQEIEEILTLASNRRWDLAMRKAELLYQRAPDNQRVERLNRWVKTEAERAQDKALEDRIRGINDDNSVFSPTPLSLLTEENNRGLPPKRDVRDVVEYIEKSPYIPDSYLKNITREGTLDNLQDVEGPMAEKLSKRISLKMNDATLEQIIFDIGEQEELNFIADKSIPAFGSKLTINFDNVTIAEFLDYVTRNMGVQFQVGDDLIWVIDGSDPNKLKKETLFYRLRYGFLIPAQFGPEQTTETRVVNSKAGTETITTVKEFDPFVVDGTPPIPAIEDAIIQFVPGLEYMIDYERNLIVANGTREQHQTLRRIIEEFDRPIQQVLIEARIVTISQAAYLQLGANWETGRPPFTQQSSTDFTGFGPDNVGLGLEETFRNILNRDNLSVTLTALEQSGESHTLSSPRITLLNNRPGIISDGKIQNYYEEYEVKQTITDRAVTSSLTPKGKPTTVTSGVTMKVLASIGADGNTIYLALNPEINQDVQLVTFAEVQDGENRFEIRLPESRTQSLETRLAVKSGETVVMGGVLERDQSTFVESVPILSRLPMIGAAFRRRVELDKPRYLLIFVKATVISESGEFINYQNDPLFDDEGGGDGVGAGSPVPMNESRFVPDRGFSNENSNSAP